MKHTIRLVALDLDGTLLNKDKEISSANRAALAAVQAEGILVVPITGRPAQGLPKAVLELPEIRYVVTSNGATIRDLIRGETLLERHLDADICLKVLAHSRDYPIIREVFREGIGYLSQADYDHLCQRYQGTALLPYFKESRRVVPGTLDDFLRQDPRPVEELFFLTESPEMRNRLRLTLASLPCIAFAEPFPSDLEVLAGSIDEGVALAYLLRLLGIDRSETLAIGDGGSDLPMLEQAGIGIAMANAGHSVQAAADFVTASCDEDGVAQALERFILSKDPQ